MKLSEPGTVAARAAAAVVFAAVVLAAVLLAAVVPVLVVPVVAVPVARAAGEGGAAWVEPTDLTPSQRAKQAEARASADAAALALVESVAACPQTREQQVALLADAGDKAIYDCLLADDGARQALLDATLSRGALDPVEPMADATRNRFSRALTLHRAIRIPAALRVEDAITVQEVHAINAADLRLLRDAVYAHRGRRSPSPEHAAVFEQFDWYRPSETFTKGRLTALDEDILAFLDAPAALASPPSPPSAADAMAESNDAVAADQGTCGCASVGSRVGGGSILLLGLVLVGMLRRAGPRGRYGEA